MKTYCLALITSAAVALAAAPNAESDFTAREWRQGFRDGLVIAKPKAEHRARADADETREGLHRRRHWARFDGMRVLELPAGETSAQAVARLMATGRYEFVEPVGLHKAATTTPNDPNFGRQWALMNTGTNNGIVGADIKATAAWDVRTDASNVIVAIIDTGVKLDHPDLAANLWRNSREIAGNGRDDDGDGYVDDVFGINAIANNGNPSDDAGHGTHVAGIIGAIGNNGVGVAGIAWRVQIMALKFLRASGGGDTADAIECIDYAIAHGAHIINASFGSEVGAVTAFNRAELLAIQRARDAGIIFVAAAGNSDANLDFLAEYPASFRLENVISVSNSTARDDIPVGTNFGSGSVELFAPGSEIYSTWYRNNTPYTSLSGTSMSAPHVAGALALLKAQFPGDTYRQLINRVLRNVDVAPAFAGKAQTGGRLNLDRAIRSTDNRPFNDDFATRARVSGSNVAIRSVNTGATSETEPAFAGQTAGATLWWEWTPTVTSNVRVSTAGSSYDTLLGIFTGTTLDALTAVASNDDEPGRTTSRLEFTAQAGTAYQIGVGGKGGGNGLTLIDLGTIPPNDNFANAQTITGRSAAISAANAQATLESGEPRILNLTGGKSLWYRWVAPDAGKFQFTAQSDGFDPILAVYTGTALDRLTVVGASDNADAEAGASGSSYTTAIVTVNATAGTTYFIQIDGRATGNTPPTTAPFTLLLNDSRWQALTGDGVTCAPTIGPDGAVYVGSTDGFFHAFNADGTRRWPAIDLNESGLDTSAAALAPDGTLYFGSGPTEIADNAALRAVTSSTGAIKWEITVGDGTNANNAVALAADGTIYVHSDEGRLFAFTDNGTSATQKWSAAIPGESYASAVIAPDGTIYLGTDDVDRGQHKLYAVNPDGTTKWTFATPNPIYTTVALDAAGNLYFGTLSDARFYSLTPAGTQRWVYTGARVGTSSSPALSPDGSTVYFGAYDSLLHAVNTADGTARWRFTLGKEVRASSPAIDANGVVYVGCYDNFVYAVNPDGTLRRTWATGGIVRSSPAIFGTTLYIGSNDKGVYALEIGAGPGGAWPQYRHNARRTGRAVVEALGFVQAPRGRAAVVGESVTLQAIATGSGVLAYQWFKDGQALAGATRADLVFAASGPAQAGNYLVTISNTTGLLMSAPAAVTVRAATEPVVGGRLVNLSVRTTAGTGAQTLIVGFFVNGMPDKPVLIRAIGPSLGQFGLTGTLGDPRLQLLSGSSVLTANDNWANPITGNTAAIANAFTAAGAFPLDAASLDAALVRTMSIGSYTAQVTGATGTGLVLAELYDTAPDAGARLVNVSARSQVNTGSDILIAGFSLSGNQPKTILVRGIGPALAPLGVTGALVDPKLALFHDAAKLAENDDWATRSDGFSAAAISAAFVQVGAFGLGASSKDAALLVTLVPGNYTAQLSGVNSTSGVGLVEVYELP